MTSSRPTISTIIWSNDPPPFAAPNARSRAGTHVHRTAWLLECGDWLAYPVCHIATRKVRPGDWTRDDRTCSNCPWWARKWDLPPQPRTPLPIVKLQLQLWAKITESIADLRSPTAMAGLCSFVDGPAAQATYLKVVDIHRELRSLVGQCRDHDAFELACLYIADHRRALLEILRQEPTEHRPAA